MEEKSFDGVGVLKIFGKCFVLEMLISVLGMFILALVLSKTGVSDSVMGEVIIGISAFAISIGAFLSSRKLEMKGILCGIIHGILYMATLYLISSIASGNFSLALEGNIMILVGITAGSIGGIIGANLK